MSLSNQIEITIKCPKCRKTIKKRLSDIQRHPNLTCTCGTLIELDGFKSLGKEAANLDKAITKLRN